MADTSKSASAKSKTASPAKAAPPAAPMKTVKVVKPPSGNQAVVVRKTRTPIARPEVPAAERPRLIAETAYYLAEARGFDPGHEASDWHAAERSVDQRFHFT